MAAAVTTLPASGDSPELAALRHAVLALATGEGPALLPVPGLNVYRFTRPAPFRKVPAFGVTLGVVLQGAKHVRVEGLELSLDPSHFLVILRETLQENAVIEASPARPYLGFSLAFSPERVARALIAVADAGEASETRDVAAARTPFDPAIAAALGRLLATLGDPVERALLAPLAIEEVLLRLLRTEAAATVRRALGRGDDAGQILGAMAFMRAHATEPLTVSRVARQVAMSPSHFAHRFRSVARVSPMRYLRELRLEEARVMLLGGASRIAEVADRVGYGDAAHFAREFKRRFGISPSAYALGFTGRAPGRMLRHNDDSPGRA